MSRRLFKLVHQQARAGALQCVREAPEGFVVTVAEPTRNGDQNAKFHAICHELAKHRVEWAGKPRSLDEWKVLLVSGHAVATKQGGEIVPGLEGEFVSIRESTASMSKARSSSLIEYAVAFLCSHVELNEELA